MQPRLQSESLSQTNKKYHIEYIAPVRIFLKGSQFRCLAIQHSNLEDKAGTARSSQGSIPRTDFVEGHSWLPAQALSTGPGFIGDKNALVQALNSSGFYLVMKFSSKIMWSWDLYQEKYITWSKMLKCMSLNKIHYETQNSSEVAPLQKVISGVTYMQMAL